MIYDEVKNAEELENEEEIIRLRKSLDPATCQFTKLSCQTCQ